jgi:hypothetical protein
MTEDEDLTQTADVTPQPTCSSCGLPLHVLQGGLQIGSDGTSIVNVAILGCVNTNCNLSNQEQSRNETPVNTFAG